MNPTDSVSPGLLVVLGAIPGAWIRFGLVSGGARRMPRPHWATWGVNMLACFLLGVLMGVRPLLETRTGELAQTTLAIGFLGGMSTYSTFIAELVTAWRRQGRLDALFLGVTSLLGGGLACLTGQVLARAWR
jgi:CrcB protein